MSQRRSVRALGAFLLFLALAPAALAAGAVTTTVALDDGRHVVIDVRVASFESRPVVIDGQAYVELRLPGEAVTLDAGSPDLPFVARSVIVPDDAEIGVEVLRADCRDIEARVVPSKGNLLRTVDPDTVPYRFGPAYHVSGLQPAALATVGAPYLLREKRGVDVRVWPLRFDAASGTVRFCSHLQLDVKPVGTSTVNVPVRAKRARPSRAFEAFYAAHFLNHASRAADKLAYPPVNEEGEMLVIAHDPWIPNLDPLVQHRDENGIPTTVVGVSTVGNTAGQIKSYIQQFYDTHDLAFVLLVGDAAQVATNPRSSGGESGASDAIYAKLAGSDDYPDVLVGRFSALTAAQVDTQVLRTTSYETLPATEQDWFWRGVGIASSEGAGSGDEGQSDQQHEDEIRGWLLDAGYTSVNRIYDPGATDQQVADALNAGRGIVNYTGHGSATSWGTTGFDNNDVNALGNKDLLPFVFSVACNNGEFHHYDACFGEAWLRATKDGRPTGAASFYGSSVSQSWAPPMEAQDEFNLRLADPAQPYHRIGALFFAASSSMIQKYGADGVVMFDTWVVFGDPALRVVGVNAPTTGLKVDPKDGLVASGRPGGAFTPDAKTYTLRNLDAAPLEFAASADRPWVEVDPATGTIPASGTVEVAVRLGDQALDLDLGTYAASVQFTNLTSHAGDTTRAVSLSVGGTTAVRRFAFDADPGWTTQGEWRFGRPTGQGGVSVLNPDPTSGATGTNVYGANLDGGVNPNPGGPYWLTSRPIDLSGVHGATLVFRRWLNTVGPPYAQSMVEVSNDGTHWTRVWTASGQSIADDHWVEVRYDVSSVADDRPAVSVRWGYEVDVKLTAIGSGWNIDDVTITGRLDSARTTLSVARDTLSWTPIAGAASYDAVRGDAATLLGTAGDFTAATAACVASAHDGTTLPYADEPAAGAAFWLLVRGRTAVEPLTYQDLAPSQVGARDAEIDAAAAACP